MLIIIYHRQVLRTLLSHTDTVLGHVTSERCVRAPKEYGTSYSHPMHEQLTTFTDPPPVV